jgi:curli biogenesis system outer membrane secretion channel CsgG
MFAATVRSENISKGGCMKKSVLIAVCVSLLLVVAMAGCAPKVKSRVLMPAEVNLKGYKNVAVIDFDGQGITGKNISRWLEAALLDAKVGGAPYFKVVTRSQLTKVLKEQEIQMTGLTDPATSKQVGKILGIDAIISGTIDGYDIEDGSYKEERQKSYRSGEKTYTKTYYVECTERRAYVSFTVNFIGVETGNIEISEPVSFQRRAHACGGARNTQLPPRSQMLRDCAQVSIERFVKKITPHYVWQELKLKNKDDSAGGSFLSGRSKEEKEKQKRINEYIKNGCEYAKYGDWDNALREFHRAVELKPESPAANYNLGVVYETRGELEKARDYYKNAAMLKADGDYIKACSHIETRIKKRDEVKQQIR